MIPILDLRRQHARLEGEIAAAIRAVFDRSIFILGPELEAFEAAWARAAGARFAVGVASGTAAITLALRALGLRPHDEVLTTPLTAIPTASAIRDVPARVALADVDPATGLLSAARAAERIGPRTRVLLPVHLHGRSCDMEGFARLAAERGVALAEDCAQAHLARSGGQPVGRRSRLAAWSFYPSKNLGAVGDAGAVTTDDAELFERLRRLRNYGSVERDRHDSDGVNARLDEIQAAVLRVKLEHLAGWTARRAAIAARYDAGIAHPGLRLPSPPAEPGGHVHHLYALRAPRREELRAHLAARGIGTLVHYPVPVHRQPAFADLGLEPGSLPAAERAADELLSLPLWPEMTEGEVDAVIEAVNSFPGGAA